MNNQRRKRLDIASLFDRYLDAVFRCRSQRFLTASAMRFLPSGEMFRFFFPEEAFGVAVATTADGRPTRFLGAVPPVKRAFACSRRTISWSISDNIFAKFIVSPYFTIRVFALDGDSAKIV
jgi:hypothetical protein